VSRLYRINPDSFAAIKKEPEAYCFGFLLADGWVLTGDKGISVAVGEDDISVLDYIRKTCQATAPYYVKSRSSGFNAGGSLVGLNLCSRKMADDLASLGLTRNKSASAFLPDVPNHLMRHVLRGLFDGDGYIGSRQFILAGSSDLLNDVVRIGRNVGAALSVGTANNYPRLVGSRGSANFLRWLYEDCEFALPRKLAIFREHWKHSGT
jgi:hypothetical protein